MLTGKTITGICRWTVFFMLSTMLLLFHEPREHVQAAVTYDDVTFTVKSDVYGVEGMTHAKIFLYEEWNWSMKISEWDEEKKVHRITFNAYDDSDTYDMLVLAPGFRAYHIQNFQLPPSEEPIVIDLEVKDEDYVQFADEDFKRYIGEQLYTNYEPGIDITKEAMQYVQWVNIYCGDSSWSDCNYHIESIQGIEYATHLYSVRIDGQMITSIEPLAALTNLRYVEMNNNRIESIAPLANLPKLEGIYMDNNLISGQLPEFLSEHLESIHLSDNRITDFSNIANAPALEWLDLSANDIQTLPEDLNMPSLQYLNLSLNLISDIEPLWQSAERLQNLYALHIGNNFVADISGLHQLESLDTLDVSYNRVTDIEFLKMMKDRFWFLIDLSGNPVSDFRAIEGMEEVYQLYLQNMDLSSEEAEQSLASLLLSIGMERGQGMTQIEKIYVNGGYFNEGTLDDLRQLVAGKDVDFQYFDADDWNILHEITDQTSDWKVGEPGTITLSARATGEVEEWEAYNQFLRIYKDGILLRQNEIAVDYSHCELYPLKYAKYGVYCIDPVLTFETEGFTSEEGVRTDVKLEFAEPGTYLIAYDLMDLSYYDDVKQSTQFLTVNVKSPDPIAEGDGTYIDTDPVEGKVSGYVIAGFHDIPGGLDTSRYMFKLMSESGETVSELSEAYIPEPGYETMIKHPLIGEIPAEAKYIGIYAERQQSGEHVLLMSVPLREAKSQSDVNGMIRNMLLAHIEVVDLTTIMPYLHMDLTGTGEVTDYGISLWLHAIDALTIPSEALSGWRN